MLGKEAAELFESQLSRLGEVDFCILLWATKSEGRNLKYNITNCFDDLKSLGFTRTKQTAVATLASLAALCFTEIREERNRKNIYITKYGAKALARLVAKNQFKSKPSAFLEER